MTRVMIGTVKPTGDQDPVADEPGDGMFADPQQAWQLANEARDRGEWARVAKLVRLARSAAAGS